LAREEPVVRCNPRNGCESRQLCEWCLACRRNSGDARYSGDRLQGGATAEEILYQYPSLNLADVYAVIAYYLQHRSEVEAYLQQRQAQEDEARRQNEARFDPQGIRERLLARRAEQEAAGHATAGC
jgi:hypothetical protein